MDSVIPPKNWVRGVFLPKQLVHISPETKVAAQTPPRRYKRVYADFAGVRPLHASDFVWPDDAEIRDLQQQYKTTEQVLPGTYVDTEGLIRYIGTKVIWVPREANNLQLRLMVIAHSACAGHRGINATRHAIQERFSWPGLQAQVYQFCKECLHCAPTRGGSIVPRALGTALHATVRNQVLHLDFLHMTGLSDDVDVGADVGEFNELLVIKDDLSHYTELFPARTPDAEGVASSLLDWFSRFGVPSTIVSDATSHFKNKVLEILAERMAAHHQFTLPHCPWSNGTVERANHDVLQVFRALLSEYRLLPRQWLLLKPVVQMSINHTLVTTLGGQAPITIFTGLPASNPLDIVFLPPKAFSATRLTAERIAELTENLRTSLQAIHKTVVRTRSSDDVGDVGDVGVDATDVRPPKGVDVNFDVGDYVLWAKDVSTHKQH